ncbi:HBR268Wp [Eremothecium sinecaudum]|uniref:HBR268Wp n=1 Tax=Eremothecium sinecaudum TaxID=45286 RepID=A0A120K1A0_9SACH|nr:HBR268Wp [Eremothecium sinecaudum]AMD19169.1 HBR268Wp [Eremothecium sinecaudum]
MEDYNVSIWPTVSFYSGAVSFVFGIFCTFPQLVETYNYKTVEGLSPLFVLCWTLGDLTTMIGAILTYQLPFQVLLAFYFLTNDFVLCGQYYYYGVIYKNTLATKRRASKSVESYLEASSYTYQATPPVSERRGRFRSLLCMLLMAGRSHALPIVMNVVSPDMPPLQPFPKPPSATGALISWIGGLLYVGARIPQLLKNYCRKSTDGLSPILFTCTFLSNITYVLSIFTSSGYLENPDRAKYVINALPFLVGCLGTVVFDLMYFYQHYFLYYERDCEGQVQASIPDESTPLTI